MIILSWNANGLGNDHTKNALRFYCRTYHPDWVAIYEPKVHFDTIHSSFWRGLNISFTLKMLEITFVLIFGCLANRSILITPVFYILLINVFYWKLLLILMHGVLVLCMLGPLIFRGESFGLLFVIILIGPFVSWGTLMWFLELMSGPGAPETRPDLLRNSWLFWMRPSFMIWTPLVLSLLGLLDALTMAIWLPVLIGFWSMMGFLISGIQLRPQCCLVSPLIITPFSLLCRRPLITLFGHFIFRTCGRPIPPSSLWLRTPGDSSSHPTILFIESLRS
ncbi:hypothetical protein ACS0TY_035228 [Phlomoides rotata]